jgi:hypothetical protein
VEVLARLNRGEAISSEVSQKIGQLGDVPPFSPCYRGSKRSGGECEEGDGDLMRRFIMLATVALVMTAMLVASAGIAQGLPIRTVTIERLPSSVPVDLAVCEVLADDSAMFDWRAGGEVCWVNSPVSADDL